LNEDIQDKFFLAMIKTNRCKLRKPNGKARIILPALDKMTEHLNPEDSSTREEAMAMTYPTETLTLCMIVDARHWCNGSRLTV
jgi:hypothetical protein